MIKTKTVLPAVATVILIIIYGKFNPANSGFFPKCPFKLLTGYQCPGCGSQRAVHYLLNGEIGSAFRVNALLVCSIPYIVLGYIFDLKIIHNACFLKLHKILYGERAIWILFSIIILFWILRNIF